MTNMLDRFPSDIMAAIIKASADYANQMVLYYKNLNHVALENAIYEDHFVITFNLLCATVNPSGTTLE